MKPEEQNIKEESHKGDSKKQENEKKGKRPNNRKGNRPSNSMNEHYKAQKFGNDPRWYGTSEIVELAGRFSFFKALGLPIPNVYRGHATSGRDTVPGIMQLDIIDALPHTSSSASIDAINVAARQQYALIRKANSGAKNYEWTDLILYEMARVSINQIYAFIARAYGIANVYSLQNRYLPKAILTMMGFNADDFIGNLASIRLWLNNFAVRANTLALPHSLTYFERKSWLYSHIYTDSQSAKSQIYYFSPANAESGEKAGFFKYEPTISSSGGCLVRKSLFANGSSFSNWRSVADSFLDVLLADDDCAIISGDILKAYGSSNLFVCNAIPEDFIVTPVYDPEVLSQIENAITAPADEPSALSDDTGDNVYLHKGAIMQDGAGNLLYDPTFDTGTTTAALTAVYEINPVLNFHHTDVTPDQVMVGTRLTTTYGGFVRATGGTGNYFVKVAECGTEIVARFLICRSPDATYISSVKSCDWTGTSATNVMFALLRVADVSNFDWAPKLYFFDQINTDWLLPIGDFETYRVTTKEELAKLHDTATLYMFGVPLIDNYNKA